jgi:predicted esterase
MPKIIFCGLFLVVISACNNDTGNKHIPAVRRHVVCSQNPKHSYEAYLPSYYTREKKWPVILCFDPQARGHIPVDSLKGAAEQFGFILIGSNNAKNGLQRIETAIQLLFNDVFTRYTIDKRRVYLMGFSGGGRIASITALQKGGIRGIISCAAGLPGVNLNSLNSRLYYFGIVGNKDFNYHELYQLLIREETTTFNFYISIFNGGHEWPPVSILHEAVAYHCLREMNDGLRNKNDSLIQSMQQQIILAVDSLKIVNPYAAVRTCEKGIRFLKGLASISDFEKELIRLVKTPDYTKTRNELAMSIKLEMKLREEGATAFENKEAGWWKENLSTIQQAIDSSNNDITTHLFKRLVNYYSMLGFVYASDAISSGKWYLLKKRLDIYELVDPDNKDCHFFKAQYYDHFHKPDSAYIALQTAINYGFNDRDKLTTGFSASFLQTDSVIDLVKSKLSPVQ